MKNMKKNDIVLAVAIITLTMMACTQRKQQIAISRPSQQESEVDRVKKHSEKISEDQNEDCMAIGNICLNVTREEFERQRNIFMKETPELGGLKIKSVTGLFYDNKLGAVQIISQQQDYHRKGGIAIDGWYMMYYEKYGAQNKSNRYKFNFEKGMKAIIVTDLSASDKPYSSFEQFMDTPLKECYKDDTLYSNSRDIASLWWAELKYLSKTRRAYYEKKLREEKDKYKSEENYHYVMAELFIYEEMRNEINAIIERNNAINSEKHKNDSSWSVIVVAYLPLCDKYNNDKRKKENERNRKMESDRQKELNKI